MRAALERAESSCLDDDEEASRTRGGQLGLSIVQVQEQPHGVSASMVAGIDPILCLLECIASTLYGGGDTHVEKWPEAPIVVASFPNELSTINSTINSNKKNNTDLADRPTVHMPVNSTQTSSSQLSQPPHRRRLFLGIFNDAAKDGKLRNAIRKTYLREHQQDHLQICSIVEAGEKCQIVYAFVGDSKYKSRSELNGELDMIYSTNQGWIPIYSLFQYLDNTGFLSGNLSFDFVAYTSARVLLFPDQVWPRELFHDDEDYDNEDHPIYSHPRLYSGIAASPKQREPSAPSSTPQPITSSYTLLSRQLIRDVLQKQYKRWWRIPGGLRKGYAELVLEMILSKASIAASGKPMIRVVSPFEPQTSLDPKRTLIYLLSSNSSTTLTKVSRPHASFVTKWDKYKDANLVTYQQDPIEEAWVQTRGTNNIRCRHGPRMLLGIMTMLQHDYEFQRRQAIRETYLSYYYSHHHDNHTATTTTTTATNSSSSTNNKHRICALHELLDEHHPNHTVLLQECQLAYAFIAGGNPEGPTERVEFNESLVPLVLPSPTASSEPDIVVLNIRENMKEGKSQTFLKYATTIIDEALYFDLVAKTDSDTMIFPNLLLEGSLQHDLPAFPHNVRVYGGRFQLSRQYYGESTGPIYYGGAFYFVSPDLARFVVSHQCDRQALAVFSEDRSMGNFVHAHPLPLHRIKIQPQTLQHPLKTIEAYRKAYPTTTTADDDEEEHSSAASIDDKKKEKDEQGGGLRD